MKAAFRVEGSIPNICSSMSATATSTYIHMWLMDRYPLEAFLSLTLLSVHFHSLDVPIIADMEKSTDAGKQFAYRIVVRRFPAPVTQLILRPDREAR